MKPTLPIKISRSSVVVIEGEDKDVITVRSEGASGAMIYLPDRIIAVLPRTDPTDPHPKEKLNQWLFTLPKQDRERVLDAIREAVRFVSPGSFAATRPIYSALTAPDESLDSAAI